MQVLMMGHWRAETHFSLSASANKQTSSVFISRQCGQAVRVQLRKGARMEAVRQSSSKGKIFQHFCIIQSLNKSHSEWFHVKWCIVEKHTESQFSLMLHSQKKGTKLSLGQYPSCHWGGQGEISVPLVREHNFTIINCNYNF